MNRSALVVGGTGPTGPHVLDGLVWRGFDVTIFHRGTHEPEGLPPVRHIHGDPHFPESIAESLGSTSYDVVIAAYGRTRHLANAFRGRTDHFIAIGGPPRYAGFYDPRSVTPSGLPIPVGEHAPRVDRVNGSAASRFGRQLVETEDAVFAAHPTGTCLIYPVVYGPRNVVPWEWAVMKRVLDGRTTMLLPDDGLAIHSRGAARNMAEFVLLAVDHSAVAAGAVYNCADDRQFSVRQWTELILSAMGATMEIVSVPASIAPAFLPAYIPTPTAICQHSILDTQTARRDLGYRDVIDPPAAIAESVAWYRANPVPAEALTLKNAFDYGLEDDLIDAWRAAEAEIARRVPQEIPADIHPMPHPKAPRQRLDERAR